MTQPSRVPAEYRALHVFLDGRFADTVVLTFDDIEDVLGSPLPELARLQQDWWAEGETNGVQTGQSRSWTEAKRTARVNLVARTVTFERA